MTVCELVLQRGDRQAHCSVDAQNARFVVPRRDGDETITVPTQFVPDALARLVDLGPRPHPASDVRLRCSAGQLARLLASRVLEPEATTFAGRQERETIGRLLAGLKEHWRVEARWEPSPGSHGMRAAEVLDTDDGLWLVTSEGSDVELRPTTPTAVWRLLVSLLPRDSELAGMGDGDEPDSGRS